MEKKRKWKRIKIYIINIIVFIYISYNKYNIYNYDIIKFLKFVRKYFNIKKKNIIKNSFFTLSTKKINIFLK